METKHKLLPDNNSEPTVDITIEVNDAWLEAMAKMMGLSLTLEELHIFMEFNADMLQKSLHMTARTQLVTAMRAMEHVKHAHGPVTSVEQLRELEAKAQEAYQKNAGLKLDKLASWTGKKTGFDA